MWTKLKTRLFFEEILQTDASVTEGAPSLSRFFEDPDAAAVCGSIMRFAKGLRVFDFARCARNESHTSVSDIKF